MIDDSEGRLPNLSAHPRDCIMSTLIVKRGNDRTRDYDVLVDPRAARLRADARGRDGGVREKLATKLGVHEVARLLIYSH
jgi:hypothetical protein